MLSSFVFTSVYTHAFKRKSGTQVSGLCLLSIDENV